MMRSDTDERAATAPDPASLRRPEMRRILASSFIGSTIEFYDFLIYTTASAVVFARVFFTGLDPVLATFASFSTLAIGYVARPLGGVVFGHFGDRIGRKRVLIVTMIAMGLATTAIGLLPTTPQIGQAAPVLLVVLRLVQGLAVGGEWGGAMLMAAEHAPAGRRGFAASFANFGAPLGAVLAAVAFTLVSLLPEDAFLAWGWRIPFLVSIVLVVVALVIRLRVSESPVFRSLEAHAAQIRVPIVAVFRRYPLQLVVGLLAALSELTISGMANAWSVNIAVGTGLPASSVLSVVAVGSLVLLATTVISARLCDRVGRKRLILVGIGAGVVWVVPMLLLVTSGSLPAYALGQLPIQAAQGVILGPLAAYLAESFSTSVRFTGASFAFQGASTLGAGLGPVAATALLTAGGGSVWLLATVWMAVLAVCLIAVALVPDGRRRDLAAIA